VSKSTFLGLAGIVGIVVACMGLGFAFNRCSFGFYAADAWPEIEEKIGDIDGSIETAMDFLDEGKISEARNELKDARKQADELYRRYFSERNE
jgi:hypothetical protein